MATTTSSSRRRTAQRRAKDAIVVENPATGQVVATLAAATPDGRRRDGRAGPPAPSRAGTRSGSPSAGKVLRRFQKWMCDNADRILDTEMSESGKTREDVRARVRAWSSRRAGFWAKHGAKYLARREGQDLVPVPARAQDDRPLRAGRRRGDHRPVELPAREQHRRRVPGAGRGQHGDPQAVERHAADQPADGGGAARVRDPRGRVPGAGRPRRDRRGR